MRLIQLVWVSCLLNFTTTLHAEWPQWRGPERTGVLQSKIHFTSSTKILEKWRAQVGTGFSSIVVSDGRLVTMGNADDQDMITCLDAATGEQLWQYRYESPLDPNLFKGGPTATPAISDNRVFTISRQGLVLCLSLKNGELLWEYNIAKELSYNIPSWGFAGSPLIQNDQVFLNAGSHGLCLQATHGTVVWTSSNEEDAGYSSPLSAKINGIAAILLLNAKSLNCVNANNGELLWSERWITRYGINAADPILLPDHRLLVSSGYGKGTGLIQYDELAAELLQRNREVRTQMSPGVLLDGAVYAIDGDEGDSPRLVCFDPQNIALHWSLENFGAGSLIALNDQILILAEDGKLSVIDANHREYSLVMQTQINSGQCWSPPILVGDSLYSRNSDGLVTCSTVQ